MWQGAKNHYHYFQGLAANIFYRFPSRGLTVIGVTGTEGKTTTANLIYHVLHEAGEKVSVISTTGAIVNGSTSDTGFHITTPGRFAIQAYLRKARKAGSKYVVLEVSSHGLDQYRALGIHFAVGVITNINRDHLDYHKTWEKYVHAKSRLVRVAKVAVLNKDDRSYQRIKKHEVHGKNNLVITYGLKKDADVNPHVFPFKTKLLGKFNQYNCLAAISALQALRISDTKITKGLASFKAPVGRQEIVYDKDFTVMIDFATTGFSFTNMLTEAKKLAKKRIIHVFGAAGMRDIAKRAEIGKVASEFDDVIIITAEDPRNESVEEISNKIISGITDRTFTVLDGAKKEDVQENKKYVIKIPNRKIAILFALAIAKKGDFVLITGKGHEQSMNYGKGEEPWSEHEAVTEGLRLRSV
ncbi:MAG: UDP-N-acetylmuramoyl-L-alanyl-D-glutamate--2,6-diaminopimelate ligase [Patescibacteria group bacterium]